MNRLNHLLLAGALLTSQGVMAATKTLNAELNSSFKPVNTEVTTASSSYEFTKKLKAEPIDPGIITNPGLPGWFKQQHYVEARINNDAEAVTEDIVPLVADSAGLDDLDLGDIEVLSGTLPSGVTILLACHNTSARWELNLNDIEVSLPVDANTIAASIRNNGRINTDIDENSFDLEFQLQFDYPKNVGGIYCSWGGHDIDIRVNVNVSGVEGEFDVTVEDDGSSRVQIAAIEKMELEVDNVSFDSSFLTTLTNAGISVANIFGVGCSNLTDCVNMVASDMLSDNEQVEDALIDAINQALDISLTIDGGTNIGAASLDYSVSLEEVETSNSLNRLNTKWLVDFDSDNPSTDCTDNLTKKWFFPNNNLSTDDDFDVVFPFKVITDLLYTVTRQLEPCVGLIWDLGFIEGDLEVKPDGSFDIDSVSGNELMISLPITAEATDFAFATGTIGAVAELTAEISPACGAGFEIEVTNIELADISGSILWDLGFWSAEIDAADFLADMAADVEDDLMDSFSDPIVLLPESFGLNNVDQFVSIGQIDSNSSAIVIGLNVMDTDPNCN
ncbi:MAG: hypothetical protein MI867_00195 [Pseudomonadales bacterium]|nr:hypothetical protein [Pseudomonadales bacterium]